MKRPKLFVCAVWHVFVLAVGPSTAVAQAQDPSPSGEVNNDTVLPEFVIDATIGEHKIPGEDAILRDFVRIFRNHFQTKYVSEQLDARRAVHAKSHGCLEAKFVVIDHEDADLAHAIFDRPASYNAVIRFSNGDGPAGPDTKRFASVGVAIKVLDVATPKLLDTQAEDNVDFLMVNQPRFLVRDVRGYKTVIEAREGSWLNPIGAFKKVYAPLRHPIGFYKRWRSSPKVNPLDIGYWSVLPFQLGDTTVKYLLRPDKPAGPAEHRRAEMISKRIAHGPVRFHFYMQKRLLDGSEDENMPVEDATVIWDEDKPDPVKVAEITIDEQTVRTPDDDCERLVFSPWNTTDDFRPLGSLNRARRVVYELSAKKRHEINQTENSAP